MQAHVEHSEGPIFSAGPQEGIVKKPMLVMFSKYRPVLIIVAKYGLGLGLLAWVMWKNWHVPSADGTEDFGLASALHRPIHVAPLAWATCIFVATLLLTFVRWY